MKTLKMEANVMWVEKIFVELRWKEMANCCKGVAGLTCFIIENIFFFFFSDWDVLSQTFQKRFTVWRPEILLQNNIWIDPKIVTHNSSSFKPKILDFRLLSQNAWNENWDNVEQQQQKTVFKMKIKNENHKKREKSLRVCLDYSKS